MAPKKTKKTAKPKTRRKRAQTPASRAPRRGIRIGVLVIIGLLLVTLGTYAWVDARVVERLIDGNRADLAAVLTDTLEITPETRISLVQFREEILARGFVEVAHTPQNAGEFTQKDSMLSGLTKAFRTPSGSQHPSSPFSFPLPTNVTAKSIALEPRILSPLFSGAQRSLAIKSLQQIPKHLRDAVIAIEDQRFYQHFGIDLIGIARAFIINLSSLSIAQGGSTLTQQLAKNTLFTRKRSITRKILEMFAAISIESRLSKDRILELYLNEVYLGQEGPVAIHGVGSASRTFFGKEVDDLSLSEGTLLAGMIQAPSAYSPRRHLDKALERRAMVIDKMRELKMITDVERTLALVKPAIIPHQQFERRAPFFLDALRARLDESIDLESSSIAGLRVHTGIHAALQSCGEQALSTGIRSLERNSAVLTRGRRTLEGALVAIDPASGLIRAWVGGRSYSKNQFDRVSLGKRQAGSTVKPFLYLTALDQSLNQYKVARATSILPDKPLSVKTVAKRSWEPENYDHSFRGDVTLRYALEHSLNLPAVYVSQKVGIEALANTFMKFELSKHVPLVPAIALGAIESTPLQMTSAYAALANMGRQVQPRLYQMVTDGNGETVLQSPFRESLIADERAVFVLNHILEGVVDRGTAQSIRAAGITRPIAGKTGTSNDARDAWFMGFTPNLAIGVWLGFDDNHVLGLTGGRAAVPIWTEFMRCAEPWLPPLRFIPPRGVEMVTIDKSTRQRATSGCPQENLFEEAFVADTAPVGYCTRHEGDPLSAQTERGSTRPTTPPQRRPERGFWDMLFG